MVDEGHFLAAKELKCQICAKAPNSVDYVIRAFTIRGRLVLGLDMPGLALASHLRGGSLFKKSQVEEGVGPWTREPN